MRFETPYLLWLLLVLPPALMAFYAWTQRRKTRLLSQFVEARLLPSLLTGVSAVRQRLSQGLILGAILCLVVALARPQWGFTWEEARQRGLDIVVALDTSRSMLAEDIAPNRLARAKLAVLDLMKQARTDRLGLVAFAGTAFLMCPLTMDDEAFRQSVNALDTSIIPQGGTALGPAIEAALGAFKEDADNYKVLVLFTDGEDHDAEAIAVAEKAAEAGLRIFTVGLGTAEGEVLFVTDRRGRQEAIKDPDGHVVKSRLNEKLLQEIATKGHGFYLPLRGATTVETLYERGLAPLPKTDSEAMRFKRYHERYQWPLALAMLLLIAEFLLPARARSRAIALSGKPALAAATLVPLCFLVAFNAHASVTSARKQYDTQKYSEALKEYQNLITRRPEDSRLKFNAGAAAYRDGQLVEALSQFGQATAAQDLALQQKAYYNLGNTLFRFGETLSPAPGDTPPGASGEIPDNRIAAWEQALKSFQSATNLAPQDLDAKHNYEYVKRKLEELKKEQPQQDQQQQQDKNENKDEQDKSQNQRKQQQDQQQKNDQDQKQDQQQSEQDRKQEQQKSDSRDQQQDQQKDQQKSEPKDQQEDQQSGSQDQSRQEQKDSQQQNQQPGEGESQPGQMTPQQARQLLDAQRGEEQLLRPVAPANERPPLKDW